MAQDIKSAETLALENAVDDALHLADMISEVYTGEANPKLKIPLTINEDSKSLIESLYSTQKVKRKTMRVVVSINERRTNKINKSCEVETSIGRRLYKERSVFRSYT